MESELERALNLVPSELRKNLIDAYRSSQQKIAQLQQEVADNSSRKRRERNLIGLRFTVSQSLPDTSEEFDEIVGAAKHFVSQILVPRFFRENAEKDHIIHWLTCGLEFENKFAEQCKPHIHLHVCTSMNIRQIRERVSSYFQNADMWISDMELTPYVYAVGKQYYAITSGESKHRDEGRFARYPWKQSKRFAGYIDYPDYRPSEEVLGMPLNSAIDCACEEFQLVVEKNLAKSGKLNKCERLHLYLKANAPTETNLEKLLVHAFKFCESEKTGINFSQLNSYIQSHLFKSKLISPEELAERALGK